MKKAIRWAVPAHHITENSDEVDAARIIQHLHGEPPPGATVTAWKEWYVEWEWDEDE